MHQKIDLVEKLDAHYQRISSHLGFKTVPLESYINSWAYGLDHFGRKDLAEDMFLYNVSLYPDHPSVYNTLANFMLSAENYDQAAKLFEQSLLLKEDEVIRDALNQLKDK